MKNKPFVQEGKSNTVNFDFQIIELISIAIEPLCININDNTQPQRLKSHPTTPNVFSNNPSRILQEFQNQYENESQSSPYQPSHNYSYASKPPSPQIPKNIHSLKMVKKQPLENISNDENSLRHKDTFNSHASSNVTFSPLRVDISLPSLQSEDFENIWEEKDMINEIEKDVQALLSKIKEDQLKDENSPTRKKGKYEKTKNEQIKATLHLKKPNNY